VPDQLSACAPAESQPSPALLAAQQLLLQRRRAVQNAGRRRHRAGSAAATAVPTPNRDLAALFRSLPDHLGWESGAVRDAVNPARRRPAAEAGDRMTAPPPSRTAVSPHPSRSPRRAPAPNASVTCLPDIALGMLRVDQAAAGRVWFLLRHLDEDGRGWLPVTVAREALTAKGAPLRICGWRQLRNLLRTGQDLFWQRDKTRIWLRAPHKVARALDIPRLQRRPVAIPVATLTAGIGTVRAHFYASFHSGRPRSSPIARETIASLTSVPARTQRRYEKKAHVRTRRHIALGPVQNGRRRESAGWQRGMALFSFTDYRGHQGPAGKTYLAWQLPNSYQGPHQPAARGQQKRFNRALHDLSMQGMTGNGQRQIPDSTCRSGAHGVPLHVRYLADGRLAARQAQRNPDHDCYWPAPPQPGISLWHLMPAAAELD